MTDKLNLNETSSPAPGKYCPKCYLSGSNIGACGNFALGCPEPVDMDMNKVIEVHCGPCEKTLAIPLSDVMKHRTKGLGLCSLDVCAATVLAPLVTVDPAPPALGDQPAAPKKVSPNRKP